MTTIPNAITNEQLLDAMKDAVEPAPVLFGGKTLEEVKRYLYDRDPDYAAFGNDGSVVNKINILEQLILLHKHHVSMVEWHREQNDPEANKVAQSWKHDEQKVSMLIQALMGISMGNKDPYFREQSAQVTFIGELSEASLEVIEHFGVEAPALLNKYSCAVEDALIEQVKNNNELKREIAALKGESEPELPSTDIKQSRLAGKLREMLSPKN